MKYYIIAGETSGDLHGGKLIKALLKENPDSDIRFWGGDEMSKAAKSKPTKHIKELSFMGFVEVIRHLGTILKNISFCKKDIAAFQPDVVIFIDFPGFNLRIAQWAKRQNFKTAYYISPQIWAWKESRVHAIKRDIDEMIVILPFEKEFYNTYQMNVHYVGHPLVDIINPLLSKSDNANQNDNIILLPGSRKQEVHKSLPIMLSIIDAFPKYNFIIIQAPNLDEDSYKDYINNFRNVSLKSDLDYSIRKSAVAALVTSGTATLETALLNIPQVVCYKSNRISYEIAKRIIKVKYISLVNLILDTEAVRELIQDEFNPKQLIEELKPLLSETTQRTRLLDNYKKLNSMLNKEGAAQKAAAIITSLAKR